jgi:hypothetical protein
MDIAAVSSSVAAPITGPESAFGTFGSELARGYQ